MSGPVCWRPKRTGRLSGAHHQRVRRRTGRPAGRLIVGRVDALDHRSPLNSHRINSWNALARLVFAKGGIKAAGEILGILGIDKRLRAQARAPGMTMRRKWCCSYFDPAARGHGLGRRMFETLMDAFRLAGVRDYFLFTDTTCDVGVLCASRPDAGVRAVTAPHPCRGEKPVFVLLV